MTRARSRCSTSSKKRAMSTASSPRSRGGSGRQAGRGQARIAKRELAQAELNLRYCDIVAEIDGVVTRRNVNPGNYVQIGQNLMAIRSLNRDLGRCQFQGDGAARPAHRPAGRSVCRHVRRPTGVQGPDLRLYDGDRIDARVAAAENATGNFIKVVQRLPVRIDLEGYDPDKNPCSSARRLFPTSTSTSRPSDPMPGSFCKRYAPDAQPAVRRETASPPGANK
jgi:membrane fusion protein (multidrug efflux system)